MLTSAHIMMNLHASIRGLRLEVARRFFAALRMTWYGKATANMKMANPAPGGSAGVSPAPRTRRLEASAPRQGVFILGGGPESQCPTVVEY